MRDVYPGDKSLREKLDFLHDYFSRTSGLAAKPEKYRRGHRAGMIFARLCVLDELGADSAATGNPHSGSARRHHEDTALRAIVERLGHEYESSLPLGGDHFSAGYRAGIAVARNYTTMVRDSHDTAATRVPSGARPSQ